MTPLDEDWPLITVDDWVCLAAIACGIAGLFVVWFF